MMGLEAEFASEMLRLSVSTEGSGRIPSGVEQPQHLYPIFGDPVSNGHAPLENQNVNAGSKVLAWRSPFRHVLQLMTELPQPTDEFDSRRKFVGSNEFVNFKQVLLRPGAERNLNVTAPSLDAFGMEMFEPLENRIGIDIRTRIVDRLANFLAHDFVDGTFFPVERAQSSADNLACRAIGTRLQPRVQAFLLAAECDCNGFTAPHPASSARGLQCNTLVEHFK
ncbi:hypothetical protein [Rhizobium bangladeshense]